MAAAILAEATRRGLSLRRYGDRIRCRPVGAMTAELRAAIVTHRAEILRLLDEATSTSAKIGVSHGFVLPHDAELDLALRVVVDRYVLETARRRDVLADLDRWHEVFEERAAILEHDAGLAREQADERARTMTIAAFEAELAAAVVGSAGDGT